jgi:hypothetical protein
MATTEWGLRYEDNNEVRISRTNLGPCATKLSVVFSPKAVGNENKLGGFIFH